MLINKIKNKFFLQQSDKSFINFASKYKKIQSKYSILIEAPLDDKFFLIKNFLLGKYLSEKYNYKLVYYINYNNLRELISIFKKIYYKFAYNYFSFLKIEKIYDAFCYKLVLNCYYPKFFLIKKKKFFSFKKIFLYYLFSMITMNIIFSEEYFFKNTFFIIKIYNFL